MINLRPRGHAHSNGFKRVEAEYKELKDKDQITITITRLNYTIQGHLY